MARSRAQTALPAPERDGWAGAPRALLNTVPGRLIVSFFLLGGFLLFYSLSSYLLQNRLRAFGDEARFLARTTALEIQRVGGGDATAIVSNRYASLAQQYPGASLAVVPVTRSCATAMGGPGPDVVAGATTAGPWAHVDPPRTLPAWIDCAGFGGLLAYVRPAADDRKDARILVRGVAFPDAPLPRYGVVVDLPVNEEVRQRLRGDTGVELQEVSLVPGPDGSGVKALSGRATAADDTGARAAASAPLESVSLLDYRDWTTGAPGLLGASVRLNIGEIYDRQRRGRRARRVIMIEPFRALCDLCVECRLRGMLWLI